MIPSIRTAYNHQFTHRQYQDFLAGIATEAGEAPVFKVAETPVFIPSRLTAQLKKACDEVVAVILRQDFKDITRDAIPLNLKVPHENDHPHFMVIDFAVCRDEEGELTPRLIELQGFPSLYAFQELMARQFRTHFDIPDTVNNFFGGLDESSYFDLLKKVIIGSHPPEEVVLLEVKPHEQKTRVDFYYTERKLGIKTICITDLLQDGKKLYYETDGKRMPVKRIYNRVIFDDLQRQQHQMGKHVNLFQELDVEWITHPNWFYRISKYILPFIHSDYAPKSWFLDKLPVIPTDLENYVLKPLFSFAGQGVLIDVTPADIDRISDPENWILQHKVQYAPAVETPEGAAYCEIRMMYLWPDDSPIPLLVHNLARISKSKMIGVSQGTPQHWTGGSCAFFEGTL
jgi:hypothetical protein